MRRRIIATMMTLAVSACASIERSALPDPALLGPEWRVRADAPGQDVDYASYAAFLDRYTALDADGVVRVRYDRVTAEDRNTLDDAITLLEGVDPQRLTRDQQLVYWINLYNAATLRVVLQNYPVDSIRDITDGLLSFGPWDRKVLRVRDTPLSLNDIEHRIIRPTYDEPRIHYALNCAATGCPNLHFWQVDGLDAALEVAERAYVNDPRGVSLSAAGRLTLSKIYIWFREDFGENEAEVLARLRTKAEPDLAASLEDRRRVDSYRYDWSINAAQ